MFLNYTLKETYSQSCIFLLTLAQLIKYILFWWIIHPLFRLAPPHFHEGNLTNYPVYANVYIFQQMHIFIIIKIIIILYLQKILRFAFSVVKWIKWIFMKTRNLSSMSWPTSGNIWKTGSGFLIMVSIVLTTDWPITRKLKIELNIPFIKSITALSMEDWKILLSSQTDWLSFYSFHTLVVYSWKI